LFKPPWPHDDVEHALLALDGLKLMVKTLLMAALLYGAVITPASAQSGIALAGMEVSRDDQYAYLGAVLPLPGQRIGNGFVQRYWIDYIGYRYQQSALQDIDARVVGGEAALGFQKAQSGSWWGAYLGARYANTRLSPDDPGNEDRGARWRAKLQIEGETRLAGNWRINGILSHQIGNDDYWGRVRLQTTLRNAWHVGPEFVAQGGSNYSAQKLGAYVGNIWLGGSALTLKAGVNNPEDFSRSMYAGAEFYIPF
jgi:hypothetical protein